jgi:hypothetical protein
MVRNYLIEEKCEDDKNKLFFNKTSQHKVPLIYFLSSIIFFFFSHPFFLLKVDLNKNGTSVVDVIQYFKLTTMKIRKKRKKSFRLLFLFFLFF